jgi:hypothetical protein
MNITNPRKASIDWIRLGATLAWSLDAARATFSQCLVFLDALAILIISIYDLRITIYDPLRESGLRS